MRDIFNLPLHDGRAIIIDLMMLTFAFSLHLLNEAYKFKKVQGNTLSHDKNVMLDKHQFLNHLKISHQELALKTLHWLQMIEGAFLNLCSLIIFNRITLLWFIPACLIYLSSRINESTDQIYFKQYIVFLMSILLIFWIVRQGSVHKFLITLQTGSLAFLFIQITFFILNILQEGLYQDLTQKNAFAVMMLILASLCKELNMSKMYRNFIIIGSVSAAISSTKLFFLLAFIILLINHVQYFNDKSGKIFKLASTLTHYLIILLPLFIPLAISQLISIEIDDLIEMEKSRYIINDNIGSMVSRIYSMPFMLSSDNFWSLTGNNERALSDLKFWGYPVHNLYLSLAYAHGTLLLIVLSTFHLAMYRYFARHIQLGLILGFYVIYFNDIYPMLSLFFVPFLVSSVRLNLTAIVALHDVREA
jgi:hypothetical protein